MVGVFPLSNACAKSPTIPEIFGMEAVVGDATVRRFFKSVDPALGAEWIARHAKPMWGALPDTVILDWDSTVQPKYGHQEGAERGYNPSKPGRRNFHPLLAVVAKTRLCPVYRFRACDTVSASRWHEAEPARPKFLFKLKLTRLVQTALHQLQESDWQGPAILGACQMAEARIQLTGWKTSRRVIFARTLQGVVPAAHRAEFWDRHKREFAVYVTNLPEEVNGWQIQELYRQRADTENVFDELKNRWGFSGFCAKSRATTELATRLLLMVYNLWTPFVRFIVPHSHIEAKRGRRWFLLIVARLVQSGRQKEI
jgi:hypothetical protein